MPREIVEGNHLYHYTNDDVADILADAWNVVDALNIPEEMLPVAFERAVNLISAKSILGRAGAIALPPNLETRH